MVTERKRFSFYIRSFPGWDRLRFAIAAALGLPIKEVRELRENVDPAVRLEAVAHVLGFRLSVSLYIDPQRVRVPSVEEFAIELARRLDEDVAHHNGSLNPYAYVLVRPGGERFLVEEQPDVNSDGLMLDESGTHMRPLPGSNVGHA